MRKTIMVCDLCGVKIPPSYRADGHHMVVYEDTYQVWSVGDEEYDVCHDCCLCLTQARQLGFVEIPGMEELIARAVQDVKAHGRQKLITPMSEEIRGRLSFREGTG